jgi:hypothetical protein
LAICSCGFKFISEFCGGIFLQPLCKAGTDEPAVFVHRAGCSAITQKPPVFRRLYYFWKRRTEARHDFLNIFSSLNADGQNKVIEYMRGLINSVNYRSCGIAADAASVVAEGEKIFGAVHTESKQLSLCPLPAGTYIFLRSITYKIGGRL